MELTLALTEVANRLSGGVFQLISKQVDESNNVFPSKTKASKQLLISLLNIYKPSRTLRSKLRTFGPRAFSVSGPLSWNKLPLSVRQQPTFSSFKTSLKTYLFPSH